MKVKMLVVSLLIMGFGIVLYGCSNKPFSKLFTKSNSYPIYTVAYLNAHPKFSYRLSRKCHKVGDSIHSFKGIDVFNKTNLGKDCAEIMNNNIAFELPGNAPKARTSGAVPPPSNVMPSAPADSSVLYDLPHYNKK